MHSHLKRLPQFALIGRPLEKSDLSFINIFLARIVSGDYSGATDRVLIELTKLLFEEYLKASGADFLETFVLRSVLYEHILMYKKSGLSWMVYLQKNGQLMGSVLSFPILCMINFIALWVTWELRHCKEFHHDEIPCLVNGDDILFQSDDEMYRIWKLVVKLCGFKLSIGKNYIHHRYGLINSELWDFSNNFPERLHFFNVGLLTGQSKLANSNSVLRPVWDWHRESLAGSWNKPRAHRRFVHYHREDIDLFTREGKYNLFVSRCLGGLGFVPVPGLEIAVTRFQRVVGHLLRSRYCSDRLLSNYEEERIGIVEKRYNTPKMPCWREGRVRYLPDSQIPAAGLRIEKLKPITEAAPVLWRQSESEIKIRGLKFSMQEREFLKGTRWNNDETLLSLQDAFTPFRLLENLQDCRTDHIRSCCTAICA